MKEIINAVTEMNWGSAGASLLAGRFTSAAQAIRDHANRLASEAEAHGVSFQGVSISIEDARAAGWSGPAETNYSRLIHEYSESGQQISLRLNSSAAMLRIAGQEMAKQLEGIAFAVGQLGTAFDQALDTFSDGYEKVEDAMDDLFDSPLASIQNRIDDYKNNPLLRFAESLN